MVDTTFGVVPAAGAYPSTPHALSSVSNCPLTLALPPTAHTSLSVGNLTTTHLFLVRLQHSRRCWSSGDELVRRYTVNQSGGCASVDERDTVGNQCRCVLVSQGPSRLCQASYRQVSGNHNGSSTNRSHASRRCDPSYPLLPTSAP